jgi:siroheme decarboxylase
MVRNGLDDISYRLLGLLQTGFPLVEEPYIEMGKKLGVSGEEVIRRIEDMKKNEIVRLISPVLDARSLGYQSTLVAMKVARNKMGKAEKYLGSHPGVSHGYERDHEFNIWITLSLPPEADLSSELDALSTRAGADKAIALPATKVFKLRTNFGPDEECTVEPEEAGNIDLSERVDLSASDRLVINTLQQDLPLRPDPFRPFASQLGIGVSDLLAHCLSLESRGVIRRYGASINHYRAGYKANAMTCWKLPAAGVEMMGARLAALRQVSHCYERQTNPGWTYNLFAMIHGSSKKGCLDIVNRISSDGGLTDSIVLFSTREFKKTRIQYRV